MNSTTRRGSKAIAVLAASSVMAGAAAAAPNGEDVQHWRAWLESPGGKLEFGLRMSPKAEGEGTDAWIVNGKERIAVPTVREAGSELVLRFDHYDSEIHAQFSDDRSALLGEWTKTASGGSITRMTFHARRIVPPLSDPADIRRPKERDRIRMAVQFESSPDPAVGLFWFAGHVARGTFMTTTGDYRFLDGRLDGDQLTLSVFDGAHAFLFQARVDGDMSMSGDFWSRDTWHETWTAKVDANASLPDAFSQTSWRGDDEDASKQLEALVFKDLDGQPRSVASFRKPGKPMLIEVFGSWCPNCHDAAEHLADLSEKYGDRLTMLGLAFELTGDFQRDARQVRIYREKYGIEYPLLLAGIADKAEASKSLPMLDRVRSYPTFIFITDDGALRAIYTGYSGPAAGGEHGTLRSDFERLIEEMLR